MDIGLTNLFALYIEKENTSYILDSTPIINATKLHYK